MTITRLLLAQDGLIRRDQAVAAGMSTSAIDRKLARGDWLVVHPRVYRAADHADTPRSRVRAVILWAGPTATLIGESALAWWRIVDDVPATTTIAVGPGGGHGTPAGTRAVRRAVPEALRSTVDGVPTLHRAPALLEAAAGRDPVDGARLVDRTLQGGHATVDGLRTALASFGQRHGAVAARRLVDLADGGAQSEAERDMVRAFQRAGLTGWTMQHPVLLPGWGQAHLDFAFESARLAVEVDGWAFHRDVDRFRRDARRQTALVVAGWRVLRFTWYDLVEGPDHILVAVRAALAAAA